MNYRKILDEQHRLGLSNEKMAQHIGMKSGTGYQQMIDNQTLKVSNLEKIAEVFQKPISYFFDAEAFNINQNHSGNGDNTVALENCKQLLAEKDKQIQSLEKDKEFLQNLLKSK